MSATNRGAERKERDFYQTPLFMSEALFQELWQDGVEVRRLLDLGVGTGALAQGAGSKLFVHGIDIHEPSEWTCKPDIFTCSDLTKTVFSPNFGEGYDLIISNPPYSLAQEFLTKALEIAGKTPVAFLLRLNFLGGQKRAAFWREHEPDQIWISPRRPSFTGGGTDATEYAWMLWGHTKGRPIRHLKTEGT